MFNFMLPRLVCNIEVWKWSKEYQIYVSSLGRFRDRYKKFMPIKVNQKGYLAVKTAHGYGLAHRVVMKTFRPTIDMDNLTVDHLDHNKRNNRVENLEWVSFDENQSRAQADNIVSNTIQDKPLLTSLTDGVVIRCKHKDAPNSEGKRFTLYQQAAHWVIQKKKITGTTEDKIKAKVQKAVANHSTYCDYFFTLEEDNN